MTTPLLRGILSVVLLVGLVVGQEDGGSSCSEEISAKNKDIAALKKELAGGEERVSELKDELKVLQGQMQQMSTYSETTRGELDRTQKKLAVVEEEKAAALASCAAAAKEGTNQCQRDLDAASGAKIQLEKQLRDAAARTELLNTDIKKQKLEVDTLRKQKKDAEDKSAEAVKKVQSDTSTIKELEAKIKALEVRLEQQSIIPTWASDYMREIPFIDSTYKSASQYVKTMAENPAIKDAMVVGREYYNAATSKASEMYAQAQPIIKQASGSSVEAAKSAMLKGGEIYSTLKPQIMVVLSTAETVVNDAMNSKMVVDARQQFGVVLDELKLLMKTQMKSIPSLSPYSSDDIVDMIVYGILGLPALMFLSCFGLCCCTRKQDNKREEEYPFASAPAQGSGSTRKQKGSKKSSKTR